MWARRSLAQFDLLARGRRASKGHNEEREKQCEFAIGDVHRVSIHSGPPSFNFALTDRYPMKATASRTSRCFQLALATGE